MTIEVARELGELAVRVESCERRLEAIEDKEVITGKHQVEDLKRKLSEMEAAEKIRTDKAAASARAVSDAAAARRYDIAKVVLAALLGGLVSYAGTILNGCRAAIVRPPSPASSISSK